MNSSSQHILQSAAQFEFVQVAGQRFRVCAASLGPGGTRGMASTTAAAARRTASPTRSAPTAGGDGGSGKVSRKLACPRDQFRLIIGAGGRTVRALREDTGAEVWVPGPKSAEEAITIRGTQEQVSAAAAKIEAIFKTADLRKQPFTHFLSLPMPSSAQDPVLYKSLSAFSQRIIHTSALPADSPSRLLALPPSETHLTLAMLRLPTPEHVARAASVLRAASPAIYDAVKTQTVLVKLAGAAVFGDPRRAASAHARVEDRDGRVNALTRVLLDAFVNAGILEGEEAVMPALHATVVRCKPVGEEVPGQPRPVWDATRMLEACGGAVVADKVRIGGVQLCRREREVGPDGPRYVVEAEIALP
ncbi:activating signal cointegrator 1 complex subunit [Blastocladiella emersonii ATCC 22665]|nr:activating signal cointegrator 1 complex subunit [Blastocladiella emersonii ATCC 22665]